MSATLQLRDNTCDEDEASSEKAEHSLEFHRFSESPIWQQQREFFENEAFDGWGRNSVVSAAPNNPLMAHTYVEMILAFWQDNLDMGLINPEQPLYILELGSGSGELAHGVVQQLFERLTDSSLNLLKPIYIVSDLIQANLDFASNHAKLAPFLNKEQIDFALLNAEEVNQISLDKSGVTLTFNSLHNPLVVIANNVFGCLKQDLIAIHYGKFFDGYIAVALSENKEVNITQDLQYDWRELPDAHNYDSTLLDHYLRYLNSNPILVPTGAIKCLDSLSQFTKLPSLVLSADRGISTLQQLRQQAAPEFANDASLSLPVNYHALGVLTETHSGIAMNCQRQLNSLAMSALILNAEFDTKIDSPVSNITSRILNISNIDNKNYNCTREAFLIHVDQFNPGDATFLSHAAQLTLYHHTPEIIFNYLRLSRWDYQVIDICFDNLLQQIDELQPDERNQLKAALQSTWKNYYPSDNKIQPCMQMGILAARLGLWGLGKICFESPFSYHKRDEITVGDSYACYFNLAVCCIQLGQFSEAGVFVKKALEFSCQETSAIDQCECLLQEISGCQQLPSWYDADLFSNFELSLQPLNITHAANIFEQAQDKNIVAMTGLPEFSSLTQVISWIEDQIHIAGNKVFAVMHSFWGFVGSVALHQSYRSAFFSIWIAADYQNNGFGSKAEKILLNAAEKKMNISFFFSCVYSDNCRSLRALKAIGWSHLPIKARMKYQLKINSKNPFRDVIFLHKKSTSNLAGKPIAVVKINKQLEQLLKVIDSDSSHFYINGINKDKPKCAPSSFNAQADS
ncbi:MAG: GNAT family N-acetyltransferase [Pseudomonadota bacterium]